MSAPSRLRDDAHLFIGARIEHASEREVLAAVCDGLDKGSGWICIFANFNVNGRQIDLAIFSATTTLVIEAKRYTQPVEGGVNGSWNQIGAHGTRKIRNGYMQALEAKNALRDAIAGLFGPVSGYPNSLLAITPAIPLDSKLPPSDFKVFIGGTNAVEVALGKTSGALLSNQQCEALAAHLGLERVSGGDSALDDAVLASERLLSMYASSFMDLHEPTGARLKDDQYRLGQELISPSEIFEIARLSRSTLLIRGPSGCGKSLLSTRIATECLGAGALPVYIQGKDFEGKLQKVLDAELGLLGTSTRDLVSASRRLGRPLVLFLDGYNECPTHLHTALTRALQAFSLRYGAGIVLTSQGVIARKELLSVEEIVVSPPSSELKSRLAKLSPENDNFTNCQALLEIASSGLEADLIGQAAKSLPAGASKFRIFDTVARTRLGESAPAGIRALSGLAQEFVAQSVFSVSVREFDRFCDATSVADTTRNRVFESRLVFQRGDRISFSHELFFHAFIAESAVRAARKDSERAQALLRSPRFNRAKTLIIGAIEDDSTLKDVLDRNTDEGIFESSVKGECGETARRIVNAKLQMQLAEMVAEISDLHISLSGEGRHSSSIQGGESRPVLVGFEAILPALGWLLMQGVHLDQVMSACRAMEQKINKASYDLHDEARSRKVPLRHEMFGEVYVFNRKIALSKLVSFVHSGGLSFRYERGLNFGTALRNAWSEANTHSEFYVLLAITKFTEHASWAAPYVLSLLERLKTLPYHLQLDAIDFCVYLRDMETPTRVKMTAALEGSLNKLGVLMNSLIFEALKNLGGLDAEEDNYRALVTAEIEGVLSGSGPQIETDAWNIYSRQFDHPFDSIYWEEIDNLTNDQKRNFFLKALTGADNKYVSFVGLLIRRLGDLGDPSAAVAIKPWLKLPDKRSVLPQDASEAFFAAYEAMGVLRCPLPASEAPAVDVDKTMRACGELTYWACRLNNPDLESMAETLDARKTLLAHAPTASAGALWCSKSRMFSSDSANTHIAKSYPKTALAICREALEHRESQKLYREQGFTDDRGRVASFSIEVIGQLGDADDLTTLRALCDDGRLGSGALDAIRKIEDRIRYRQ